ncbi:ImmA/IrrE family metallo-endopeptidase [Kribbella turkmenica]|uniref:ImmA/IrrE family metallo-endopeptidase n=1 Tax=Kribbella turkmenica TaxID=2530375 RepID=A0A4R4XCP3_9ACTN|nr:ImmA/IrrE family metallo-endopeptidase [Kribbella turkmenica]TDD28354.1 ImmA/IrrE family metallo-endopeptidase [Kribbella turkmenica]
MTEKLTTSVLADLRSVIPSHKITFAQAKRIAEQQANRLLALSGVTTGPQPSGSLIGRLPRIRIVTDELPVSVSGTTHWSGSHWIIVLNQADPVARQRFTLMHEFKHIIDHGRVDQLYTGNNRYTAAEQAERAADYFAACYLMPKRRLKAAWAQGIQTSARLAQRFDVSIRAMEVRLQDTRISAVRDSVLMPPLGTISTRCSMTPSLVTKGV